jgi:phenylalanyl-tRNA synthetase beta chain
MIISKNWLKHFGAKIDVSDEELAQLIGARLVEIEDVVKTTTIYEGALIIKIVKAEKVPESDHLSFCLIDDGGVNKDVERTKDGLIEIICGAPNAAAGQLTIWLPPGMIVPATLDTKEPLTLNARKILGHKSNGMLASMQELALGDDRDGIVEVDPKMAKPGDTFNDIFAFDDVLFEVENKSLTHRPDCFGVIGFAREVNGILGKKYEYGIDQLLQKLQANVVKSTTGSNKK